MKLEKNRVGMFNYTLLNDEGVVIDSSENYGPLTYLHGAGEIIIGLENALLGKKKGDALQVTVSPEEGYGNYEPTMLFEIPKEQFQGGEMPPVGSQVTVSDQNGQRFMTMVKEIRESNILLDANHPLAGQHLHFNVEIVEVREATEEELRNNSTHVHTGCAGCGGGSCSDDECDEDNCSCEHHH